MNEYSYYVAAIISGRPVNLGALFLSLFYEGLKLWIDQLKAKENKAIPSPMWFLFLWVNEYFLGTTKTVHSQLNQSEMLPLTIFIIRLTLFLLSAYSK